MPKRRQLRSSRNTQSLKDLAYRHLQAKLSSGELASGELLSEIPLAQELGISRTPVREAIGLLVAEGFLEQIPNRGTVVRTLANRDIIELYELREALEVYAVGRVARMKLSQGQKQELAYVVEQVESVRSRLLHSGATRLDIEGTRELGQADLGFHNLILRLAGNARILKVTSDTRVLLRIFSLPHDSHDESQLRDIHQYHDRIARAIFACDWDLAQKLLAEHIQISLRERLQAHENWQREQNMSRALAGTAMPASRG